MKLSALVIAGVAFLGMSAFASAAEPMKVCTGAKGGNYEYTALVLKGQLGPSQPVEVINTAGSWENLQKIASGECDAAVVQSDAIYLYERENGPLQYVNVADLYTEYAHLLCNRKSPVTEFNSLTANTKIFSGGRGSGADVTVRSLIRADEEYGKKRFSKVPLVNEQNPDVALVKVRGRTGAECLFYVGSKGNKFMSVNAEKLAADVQLVPVDNKYFDDMMIEDQDGNKYPVYKRVEMPYNTYKNLMPSGFFGNKDIATVGVTAKFIVGTSFVDKDPEGFANLGLTITDVINVVRADKKVELVE